MSAKSNGTDLVASEWVRGPPPSGPVLDRLAKAIYNPDEKSFLGRTPKRWGIVFTFYFVFYSVLALLFALCMGGLFLSLDNTRPTYILEKSLIGTNPGVAYRPLPIDDPVIRYDRSNDSHVGLYKRQLEEFLSKYANETWFESEKGCNADDSYGFPDTPCFFIKLNKIYEWKPELYDDTAHLPDDMPKDLVETITNAEAKERQQVWVSCFEEKGNSTTFEYPRGRGLPGAFYPYRNEQKYKSPLVVVKLTPPANTLVTIRCRVWAKNIVYNKSIKEPSGYTRIQLYIEDSTAFNATEEAK